MENRIDFITLVNLIYLREHDSIKILIMRHLRLLLVVLFFALFSLLSAQDGYLDNTFGDDGTALLIQPDSTFYFLGSLYLDEMSQPYFSYGFIKRIDGYENGLMKLDRNGNQTGYHLTVSDTITDSFVHDNYYIESDKLISNKSTYDDVEGTWATELSVSKINGDYLYSVDIDYGQYFWFLTFGRFYEFDSQGRMVLATDNRIERRNTSGLIDTQFGDDGKIVLSDSLVNPWYTVVYSHMHMTDDDSFLMTYVDEDSIYTQKLIRVDENGNIDNTFELYADISLLDRYLWEIDTFQNGYLFTETVLGDSTNLNYHKTNGVKVEANGRLQTSWGIEGKLDDRHNGIEDFYSHFQVGPSGEVVAFLHDRTYGDLNNRNSVNHYEMQLFDSNGLLDTTFASEGRLLLSALDTGYIYDVSMDADYNIFVLHTNRELTRAYITKYDGSLIWDIPRVSAEEQYKVFPNPAYTSLSFQYTGPGQPFLDVYLHDVQGKLVVQRPFSAVEHNQIIEVVDRAIPSGTYFLKIRNRAGATLHTSKVVWIEE